MTIQLTTTLSPEDLNMLRQIYETSFPQAEQRPWQKICDNRSSGRPTLFAILADGHIAGLATLWILDRFAYIEHLALSEKFRGAGIGSQAVSLLIEEAGRLPLVVEIEPPLADEPQTVARARFYERLGFVTIDTDYFQPPYAEGQPSVALHLLATTTLPAHSTTRELHTNIYGLS